MGDNVEIAYWNTNVPESQRTETCPDFLLGLSPKDLSIVSTRDADYHVLTWEEVRTIAAQNCLDHFQRVPSELRRYRAFTYRLAQEYGSVTSFVLNQRLQWTPPIRPMGEPFECPDDYKILYNDWPYGIDEKIVHLVVWTKFSLEDDPSTGHLAEKSRRQIERFVSETFLTHIKPDQLIWFKNWAHLKSVNAVEHFHIMMYDPDPGFMRRVTNGDVPQCDMPQNQLFE